MYIYEYFQKHAYDCALLWNRIDIELMYNNFYDFVFRLREL